MSIMLMIREFIYDIYLIINIKIICLVTINDKCHISFFFQRQRFVFILKKAI